MRFAWLSLIAWLACAQTPSWREAGPILDRWCNSCHRPGRGGPFYSTQYEGAAAYAPEIVRYVSEGKMPPWRAVAGHGSFTNSRRMPAADRALLIAWAKTGAKPGLAPKMTARQPLWNLGVPDLVLEQSNEF